MGMTCITFFCEIEMLIANSAYNEIAEWWLLTTMSADVNNTDDGDDVRKPKSCVARETPSLLTTGVFVGALLAVLDAALQNRCRVDPFACLSTAQQAGGHCRCNITRHHSLPSHPPRAVRLLILWLASPAGVILPVVIISEATCDGLAKTRRHGRPQ
jgi:hypothetical protein